MNCYISVKNLLTWPSSMVVDIKRLGMTPIICDHGSTYPPLLEWYKECGLEVRMHGSGSCYGFFRRKEYIGESKYFAVTDCDLDISGVPEDFTEIAIKSLEINRWATKVGVSLEINDVPEDSLIFDVIGKYEHKYWRTKTPDGHYMAGIGATLAVYDIERIEGDFYSAVRLDRPYTAKHIPWYYTDQEQITPEYRYYLERMDHIGVFSNWIKRRIAK